jgi:uncharacterized protein
MIAEQAIVVRAGPETLEARLGLPDRARLGVVICHPHPLYGGDMDSPIVLSMVETCAARGLATLRFNFRGVGASTGRHEDGIGELEDVHAALGLLGERLGDPARVAVAGYSFGAAMAAAVAGRTRVAGLGLVAPPLRVAALRLPALSGGPVLVVVGAEDQYCPAAALAELGENLPTAKIVVIDGADHFFFGTLGPLGDAVGAWADALRDAG